ncbi:MAG: type II toxin-antitoxin system HipA family toxin [Mycobacterium sp.]|nr:type II toxin-antitoxin system HipA family toxin [Mycobacterium sp.]
MIEAVHAVLLKGNRIGSILQRGDVARFVFEPGYWDDPNRHVLGLWFEDDPRRSPKAALRLPPWFSNLLPEGTLREWIARDQGVSAERELQLLLRIGRDLPGAVEVVASDTVFDPDLLKEPHRSATPEVGRNARWKFSLAGVGLKFSLLKQNERLTIPASDELGDWIVKLPDARYPDVPTNEFATMTLARAVGIDVPEVALVHRDELPVLPARAWPSSEKLAFAIARFDRIHDGQRIHIEDLAQVRGFYDNAKYTGSFETVGALIYRSRDLDSLQEFVRRLTFNVLIGNGDAHLKNWSLIYPDGRVPTLSPAYDLVSTAPYASPDEPDDFGLSFGGTKVMDRISRTTFRQFQDKLSLCGTDVLDVVDETVARFQTAWPDARRSFPTFVNHWIEGRRSAVTARLVSS